MTTTFSAFANLCSTASAARSALDALASSLAGLAESCMGEALTVATALDSLPEASGSTPTGSETACAFGAYQAALELARQKLVNQVGALGEVGAFARQEAREVQQIAEALPVPAFTRVALEPEASARQAPQDAQDAQDATLPTTSPEPTPADQAVPEPAQTPEGKEEAEEVYEALTGQAALSPATEAPAAPLSPMPASEVAAPTGSAAGQGGTATLTAAQTRRMNKRDLVAYALGQGVELPDGASKAEILAVLGI